jgi:hypothetical protein
MIYDNPMFSFEFGDRIMKDLWGFSVVLHVLSGGLTPMIPETVASGARGALSLEKIQALMPKFTKEDMEAMSKISKALHGIQQSLYVLRGAPFTGEALTYTHIIHMTVPDEVKREALLSRMPKPDKVTPEQATSILRDILLSGMRFYNVRRFLVSEMNRNSPLIATLEEYARKSETLREKKKTYVSLDMLLKTLERLKEIHEQEKEMLKKAKAEVQIQPVPAKYGLGGEE